MRFLLILAQISKNFLGAPLPNSLIYTSFLLKFKTLLIYPTINIQHTMRFLLVLAKISKRAPKPPDIYSVKIQDTPHISYYQHSKNHEISTNFSENIKNIKPPNIYFLPVKIQDTPHISYYQHLTYHEISTNFSANIKNFLGGSAPKPPKICFLLKLKKPLIYPSINLTFNRLRFLLILAQISNIFLGALPPNPLIYILPSC